MTTTGKLLSKLARAFGFGLCALAFGCAVDTGDDKSKSESTGVSVKMETNKGVIVLAIDGHKAAKTAANFLQYVDDGFFDGLIFHRVIPGFVIQGGGFEPGMQQRETRKPVAFENTGLRNVKYSISMARTNDPNSATSQFFINLQDNPQLDGIGGAPGYAVFGRVVDGAEVINQIAAAETHNIGYFADVPVDDIVVIKAEVQRQQPKPESQQQESQ